ncbi:hypothetical protein L3N51_02205 [Metallosphaera sp. J1]|nr:hypothetical protein [Metallosphaera javensis (ex Hofmann et al. 2022)]
MWRKFNFKFVIEDMVGSVDVLELSGINVGLCLNHVRKRLDCGGMKLTFSFRPCSSGYQTRQRNMWNGLLVPPPSLVRLKSYSRI